MRAIPRIIHGSCHLGAEGMVVAQAILANAGFHFFLAWMLLAFTRGRDGVLFVGDRLLGKEGIFTTDFDSFCKNLVKAAKLYCSIHGKSALSHVEGYHTGLSGLTFLLTLRLKKIATNSCGRPVLEVPFSIGSFVVRAARTMPGCPWKIFFALLGL